MSILWKLFFNLAVVVAQFQASFLAVLTDGLGRVLDDLALGESPYSIDLLRGCSQEVWGCRNQVVRIW